MEFFLVFLNSSYFFFATLFYSGGQFMKNGDLTLKRMMSAIFSILFAAFGLGMAQQYIKDYAGSKSALMNLCRILDEKSNIDPFESGKLNAQECVFEGTIDSTK